MATTEGGPESSRGGKCRRCGAPTNRARHKECRACFSGGRLLETPLRRWKRESRKDYRWLAREAKVGYRTVLYGASGAALSGPVAMAIHKVTDIPLEQLLTGRLK